MPVPAGKAIVALLVAEVYQEWLDVYHRQSLENPLYLVLFAATYVIEPSILCREYCFKRIVYAGYMI